MTGGRIGGRIVPVAGGVLVALAGVFGLVRAAVPQASPTPARLEVTGAFVRAPAPPSTSAAAYFTVRNPGSAPDRLVSVQTAAARKASLHTDTGGRMVALGAGAQVPAHGTLVLTAGRDHVMLEQLTAPLRPGGAVVLALTFERAGTLDVTATVIAPGATAPTRSAGR